MPAPAPRSVFRLVVLLLLCASAAPARAQDRPTPPPTPDPRPAGTGQGGLDTLGSRAPGFVQDTLGASSPILVPVPVAPAAEGGLQQPVRFTAVDSMRISLAPASAPPDSLGDTVSLFGSVETDYEGAKITAGRVDYDARTEQLRASAVVSDSGEVGRPTFSGEEGEVQGRTFVYSLRSQRGRVTGAKTQIQDGYLLGGIIKQQDAHVVFAQDAAYTTCDLDHPHYAVEAGRIKVVDGERVYTGPVQLKLLGIPMPLVLPFGYFPAAEGRRSGPLAVRYGQETGFGLFLDNVGWYWAISDYLDAQLAGKVGTQGSFQGRGSLRYNRRYAYNGRLGLSLGRLRSGESTDPGFAPRLLSGVTWNHNQTLPAGQTLTANVNLSTSTLRQTSEAVSDQISATTNSSVNFSQQWPAVGRSLRVSGQVSQNFQTDRTEAQFPQFTFAQQRRFPFKRGRDDRWWEKISLSYDADARNAFAYQPADNALTDVSALDALFSPSAFREGSCAADDLDCDPQRFSYQVVQRVPIAASYTVPRFNLSFGPTVNVTETWADAAVAQTYDPELGRAVSSRVPGFTAVRQVSLSASASTDFYGTFPIRVGALNGVRHTVSPRVSASFQPDYADFGFVREVQVDSLGTTRRYAIHPSIPTDPTRSLSYGIGNTFVARTTRTDSTGAEQSQTRQILDLNVTGGINFAAERRPILPVQASLSSDLFGFRASGSLQFTAYAPDTVLTADPVTYFDVTGRPLRLRSANFRVNRTFQSSRTTGPRDQRAVYAPPTVGYDPGSLAPRSAAIGYVDYSAPWSVATGFTLSRQISEAGEVRTTAAVDVSSFRAQLTPNWALSGSTGFDLMELDVTLTRVALVRDLHCWEMAVNWQPIGAVKLFSVSLYVKSGFLRDLLRLDVPNSTSRSRGLGGIPGAGAF